MNFQKLVDFLAELQHNNSKEWMDKNRKRYKNIRSEFILWLDHIDARLAAIDRDYYSTPGKKGINRINNNLMYHPHKPIYKDYFAAGLDKAPSCGDFYLEIGVDESLFAGGIWRPEPSTLKSIREAIDYNGTELEAILNQKSFRALFGDLYEGERLKTAPKGFSIEHPQIELLKNKTFGVVHRFPTTEVFKPTFEQKITDVYLEMLPFRRYLNQAITV